MNTLSPDIRRRSLCPLARRKSSPANLTRLQDSFREIETRAIASSLLPDLAEEQRQAHAAREADHWKDPKAAKRRIALAQALYLARRTSLQDYVFAAAHAVESVHEGRLMDHAYPEIETISVRMRKVEQAHGLSSDQYWLRHVGPESYDRLSRRWDRAVEKRLRETYAELEGQLAYRLFNEKPEEFERLRERGRRAIFHRDALEQSIADTVRRYEHEARASANAGAYTAAVTLLGAALEGLLVLRCLKSPEKASSFATALPARQRPKDRSAPSTWSLETLVEVCLAAGWLPSIRTEALVLKPAAMAHQLRKMRNNIHPGRVCRDRPWIEMEHRDFEDADAIYTTLFARVFQARALAKYVAPEQVDDHAA